MTRAVSHHLYVETVDGVAVASFADDALLADEIIHEVEDQFQLMLESYGTGPVLVNFRGVRFLSSTMLAVLVKFARRLDKSGGRLKVCGLATHIREVFRLGCFDRYFTIHDDETAALDAFAQGK